MKNLFLYVSLRHLRGRPVRTLLTSMSVALGVALFVAISLINRSTLESFKQNFEAISGKAVLAVTAGETGFPETTLEKIEQVPGVRSAAPMIETRAYLVGAANSSETVQIFGVDLLRERSVRTYKTTDDQPIEDPLVFLNQPDSIMISRPFAEKHGLKMESPLSLATAEGVRKFTVRGIMNPEGPAKAFGGAVAIMDIDGAAYTFGKQGRIDRVDVMIREGENVEALGDRLRAALGPAYSVEAPEGQSEGMTKMVASYQKLMALVSSLALMVGLFMVTNTIAMSVAERRREVGTLRALGATKRGILSLFLIEAVVMGTLGAIAGAFLGHLLSLQLVETVARAMSQQYLMPIATPAIRFGADDLVRSAVLGAVASFLAALWPALKTNSIQPIEAIRSRKDEEERAAGRLVVWAFWLGLAGFAYITGFNVLGFKKVNEGHELFNQTIGFLAVAGLAPRICGWIVVAVRACIRGGTSTVARLAQDNLLRNPRRTASNVLTLMVGLVLVVLISSMNASFRNSIGEWADRVLQSDLYVSSGGKIVALQTQPIQEEIRAEIEAIPLVRDSLAGWPGSLRFIHTQFQGRTVGLKAFSRPDPKLGDYSSFDVKDRPLKEAGDELFNAPDLTIMVSTSMSSRFGIKTGDRISLTTPAGPREARIVGLVTDFASNEGVIYMNRDRYKEYWGDGLVNFFALKLKPGADVEAVRVAIDSVLGRSRGLIVTMSRSFKDDLLRVVDQSFSYLGTIEIAALLIALLGLFNTMSISIMERIREFGLLRAVGMSRPQVFRMVLLESVTQGGVAVGLALAAGAWLAFLWVTYGMQDAIGWTIDFHFPFATVLKAGGAGLIVAWLAGIFPSRRAANLQIREALTYE